ncbi:MAG: IS110 family transposase [Thaumarchaeota archaeon]|nr:IS110 family transposase [Nitrososphaerota archaeon]
MDVSIGIDVAKRKCDYCVIDGSGAVVERGAYQNTASGAGEFARRMARRYAGRGTCRAACETTASMWRITYDAVEAAGIDIKLANTFRMSIISKTAKKTDKVDAEKIAQVLRMDMIPECYVPDRKVRGVRDMIRQRIKMVRNRTQVINRTHSMLDAYDIRPAGTTMYGKKTLAQLEGTTLADRQDDYILKQHARQIRYLTGEIEDISTRLESIACGNRYARLLTSMTGVGAYSALLLASEIDDVSRFARPKHIVSMAGLCPGVSQSGGAPRMTRIKKLGTNRLVNWVMCEAANVAIQHDPRMAAVYEAARRRHAGRHGPAISGGAQDDHHNLAHAAHDDALRVAQRVPVQEQAGSSPNSGAAGNL